MAIFGTNIEFSKELKRRRTKERHLCNCEATARSIDENSQWKVRYFNRAKNHLVSLEVVSGVEFIYRTKHMPGNMLCKVKSICNSFDEVIEFEVIASDVVMRVLPTFMSAESFVPRYFKVSSDSDFAEMKNNILASHIGWTQKDRKVAQGREQKALEKERDVQAKQVLVNAYHAEIKDKGFIVGSRVMSPTGLSVIKHFNHKKLTIVVTNVGQALPRSYKTEQLSPFTG